MHSFVCQEEQRVVPLGGPLLGRNVSVVLSRLTVPEKITRVCFVKRLFIQVFSKTNFEWLLSWHVTQHA